MLSRFIFSLCLATMIALCGSFSANAEQVIPKYIEYSNDKLSDGGTLHACIVTLVVLSPPDPRTLNFQFLAFRQRMGWKITGGWADWKTDSTKALRAADGSFSSSSFIVPKAFQKNITPEGQLVGVLTQNDQTVAFAKAFFGEPFSVEVRWEGTDETLNYYIDKPVPEDVRHKFSACLKGLVDQS